MSSIKQRPNGMWRARYRDPEGIEHVRHFKRKKDGDAWLKEVNAAIVTGQYVNPKAGAITYRAYYSGWADRQIWVPSTRANADHVVSNAPFADKPLAAIKRSDIEAWIKDMNTRLAPTTIKTRYVIARSVFRAAVKDRLIATDPAQDVVLPRRRRTEAAMRIPTVEQVGTLVACADSPRVSTRQGFRAYVAVCAFAGLRLGEAAGLQVGDIDFLRRTITVSRQLQRDGGTYAVRPPKYGSERVVYVPDELLELLAQHIQHHAMGEDPDRWLFSDDQGVPIYDNAVTWRWRETRKAAGLPTVRLHDLRHFFASGLIADGCDPVTVQRALGHASATTTLNTYSHLWPTAEDRTRKASASLIRSALADSVRTDQVV